MWSRSCRRFQAASQASGLRAQYAAKFLAPTLDRNAFVREIRDLVEARQHRVEFRSIDALTAVLAVRIRLVEPAVRARGVLARHAKAVVDHPLDAHDVQADAIELLGRHREAGDVRELRGEFL